MRRPSRRSTLAAALLAAGCHLATTAFRRGEKLSDFPHATHVDDQGLACDRCHPTPAGAAFPGFPARELCADCHDDELVAPFFARPWARAGLQDEEVTFDHARHVAAAPAGDADDRCLACHRDVAESDAILSTMRMSMDACVECHKRRAPQTLECDACHREWRRDSKPPSHRDGWLERHGDVWRADLGAATADRCALCHEHGSCDDCHASMRPRSHTQYWRGRGHGLVAGMDRSRCEVCHRRDTCDRCHSSTRPQNHTASFGAPQNRHCYACHMPVDLGERCGVCHLNAPSHALSDPMPSDAAHTSSTAAQCRACHTGLGHPDNGDDCRYCHR
jgi:hypothetical protein